MPCLSEEVLKVYSCAYTYRPFYLHIQLFGIKIPSPEIGSAASGWMVACLLPGRLLLLPRTARTIAPRHNDTRLEPSEMDRERGENDNGDVNMGLYDAGGTAVLVHFLYRKMSPEYYCVSLDR